MWNVWLPLRLLPLFWAEALPALLLFLLLLRMPLLPECVTTLDLALTLALTVALVLLDAEASPPVAVGLFFALPVVFLSRMPCAVAPVPAARRAAPTAAAAALRMFMLIPRLC